MGLRSGVQLRDTRRGHIVSGMARSLGWAVVALAVGCGGGGFTDSLATVGNGQGGAAEGGASGTGGSVLGGQAGVVAAGSSGGATGGIGVSAGGFGAAFAGGAAGVEASVDATVDPPSDDAAAGAGGTQNDAGARDGATVDRAASGGSGGMAGAGGAGGFGGAGGSTCVQKTCGAHRIGAYGAGGERLPQCGSVDDGCKGTMNCGGCDGIVWIGPGGEQLPTSCGGLQAGVCGTWVEGCTATVRSGADCVSPGPGAFAAWYCTAGAAQNNGCQFGLGQPRCPGGAPSWACALVP